MFTNRSEAGKRLARYLMQYAGDRNTIVLGLPRGGVPVAYEVAALLHLPLDVYLVRKLGAPGHEEMAIGALAADGSCVVDDELLRVLRVSKSDFDAIVQRETEELHRRSIAYRDGRPEPDVKGKNVIVVDDGLATGASMISAVHALRQQNPAKIIVAVPIASGDAIERLNDIADSAIAVEIPRGFFSVGLHYLDFAQTSDDEVRALLKRAQEEPVPWHAA